MQAQSKEMLSLRVSADDLQNLKTIAVSLGAEKGSPFVSMTSVVRYALDLTARALSAQAEGQANGR